MLIRYAINWCHLWDIHFWQNLRSAWSKPSRWRLNTIRVLKSIDYKTMSLTEHALKPKGGCAWANDSGADGEHAAIDRAEPGNYIIIERLEGRTRWRWRKTLRVSHPSSPESWPMTWRWSNKHHGLLVSRGKSPWKEGSHPRLLGRENGRCEEGDGDNEGSLERKSPSHHWRANLEDGLSIHLGGYGSTPPWKI